MIVSSGTTLGYKVKEQGIHLHQKIEYFDFWDTLSQLFYVICVPRGDSAVPSYKNNFQVAC